MPTRSIRASFSPDGKLVLTGSPGIIQHKFGGSPICRATVLPWRTTARFSGRGIQPGSDDGRDRQRHATARFGTLARAGRWARSCAIGASSPPWRSVPTAACLPAAATWTARIWSLPPVLDASAERLAAWVQTSTGLEPIRRHAAPGTLDPEARRQCRRRLDGAGRQPVDDP